MKVIIGIFLALATYSAAEKSNELRVLQGNAKFTKDLYNVLSAKKGENIFFSPLSAHAVLSLTSQGARGETSKALGSTLYIGRDKAAKGYSQLMDRLNSVQDVTLLIANKIFVKKGNKDVLIEFQNSAEENFKSKVQALNFVDRKARKAAARIINNWVEKKTHKKIKNLISTEDLDDETQMVLVNAIYFKGEWATMFDPADTKKTPFHSNAFDWALVDMMTSKSYHNYRYDKNLAAKILELPFGNNDLSMVVILPDRRTGITKLESKLQSVNLTKITKGMAKAPVHVQLPKFKIETTIDLKDTLKKMGLGIIFEEQNANFSGIIPVEKRDKNLYVSKVIQKTMINVYEKGVEAAAATAGLILTSKSAPISQHMFETFNADHPFIFVIESKTPLGSTPLFIGKLGNAEQLEN